ncbi:hypothetical protein [Bacteroides bouchesdurhonensis]|uniref:hypothetical protein n=1 Tax=Bacteroides bouchesdurhonensis TaxID=1841855 RepID=UPI0011DD8EFF|nr:hypothetical protein [Bacteroides bouchesdurhonensis]
MDFITELKKNIGCNIVYSSSGGGNCSIILMTFDNGNSVMTYCYWEVQKNGKLIATAEDDVTAVTGLVAQTIRLFENKKVSNIEIDEFLNLFIEVDDGLTLLVFRDEYKDQEKTGDYEDWTYSIPSKDLVLYVMEDSTIKVGKYHSWSDSLEIIEINKT